MNRLLKILPLFALGAATASAQMVLAGWNSFNPNDGGAAIDTTPNVVAAGVSAQLGDLVDSAFPTVGGGKVTGENYNAFNNTFGTAFPGVATDASGVQLGFDYDAANNPSNSNTWRLIDFSVTNNLTSDMEIVSIHFDVKTQFKGGAAVTNYGTVRLSHFTNASDLSDAFSNRNLGGDTVLTNFSWQDIDVSVGAMADTTLAPGETAAFRLAIIWADAAATGDPTWNADNIAIVGTAVPEPSTFAILAGFFALGLVLVRRRRR